MARTVHGKARDGSILAINSGSSSLKFGLFQGQGDDEELLLEGAASGIGKTNGNLRITSRDGSIHLQRDCDMPSQSEALEQLSGILEEHMDTALVAVGHRVVHGGPALRDHQLVTPQVKEQLRAATHFAPLHIPQSLALIEQAQRLFDGIPHFVCFDSTFHRSMPARAATLPIPRRYADAGMIHYGFHGLSYESLAHHLGKDLPERAVFAHLGSGSSLCALRGGKSVDTTMGMTPTGGVCMGSRSGDLDPGVVLYLMRNQHMDADALERLLNHDCGLAGIAEGESDMQVLLQRSHAGDEHARLAIDIFATGVRKAIGAYAALLGGIDLLVFAGGVGEHSDEVRRLVCDGLQFLGIDIDDEAGKPAVAHAPAGRGRKPAHRVAVKVMKADEERQIARHCRALLLS